MRRPPMGVYDLQMQADVSERFMFLTILAVRVFGPYVFMSVGTSS